MIKILLSIIAASVSLQALAQEQKDYLLQESDPNASAIHQIWREGTHIAAGLGIQGGAYLVDGSSRDFGAGIAGKTDVGFYLNDKWALEASSLIKFARVNDYRIWGTQLSVGFRYRLPAGWFDEQVPYFRGFAGSNINVIYLDGRKIPEFEEVYNRIQFEGPLLGVAWGGMRLSQTKTVWFWEVALTGEWLTRESGIQMEKDVPVVVARSSLDGRSQLYSVYVTMGGFIF
ncbi:hypothetical protein ACLVWU_10680 [Bdellovibrio sp. HCB290]|uniref:hypothetical protein n=1 Tax=Bdellovibrio sp. HCB290 TaxID=3394356 RepID=UPI0039B57244